MSFFYLHFVFQINASFVSDHNTSLGSSLSGQGRASATPVQWNPSPSVHGSQSVLNRSDGSIIAVTPQREHRTVGEKDVSANVVKYSRLFSILSIFCFPPTGLAAFYFARKAKKDFELHDQTSAKRHVKYCERLIILSVVLGILMYTLIFAAIGRAAYGNQDTSDGSRATAVWRHDKRSRAFIIPCVQFRWCNLCLQFLYFWSILIESLLWYCFR